VLDEKTPLEIVGAAIARVENKGQRRKKIDSGEQLASGAQKSGNNNHDMLCFWLSALAN
jgi:hypothetical protein